MLFPYSTIRPGQNEFLNDVKNAVENGKILLADAPTGIGKTAAVLGGSLEQCLERNKTIFFLTPKHTQHKIVIDTLKKIKEKYNINFSCVDIIGKQWLCPIKVSGESISIKEMSNKEFNEYCKVKKEKEECVYFKNVFRSKNEEKVSKILNFVKNNILHSEEIIALSNKFEIEMCPYEIAIKACINANIIICDYFHIFSKSVREAFLTRIGKDISNAVIIIDEAHNLPERIREISSYSISEFSIERAIKEATNIKNDKLREFFIDFKQSLKKLKKIEEGKNIYENFVDADEFIKQIEEIIKKNKKNFGENYNYDDLTAELDMVGEEILKEKYRSYIKSIANFLENWKNKEQGFARILKLSDTERIDKLYSLHYKCLDPGIITGKIFNECYASILMSGTLLPLEMYREILGIDKKRAILKAYKSPFPKENRITIITNGLTTKYEKRSDEMYKKYAKKICEISEYVNGNIAIFFPSYEILNKISSFLIDELKNAKNQMKEVIIEDKDMKKEERQEILDHLIKIKNSTGGILCAVIGGSLSEGVDYPNNLLSLIIIVGMALDVPDLETKALIEYYEKKFKAGWKYGYVYPAINKTIQASGRGIRSENDKCAVILMDERYKWKNFYACLPSYFNCIVTDNPEIIINKFFNNEFFNTK